MFQLFHFVFQYITKLLKFKMAIINFFLPNVKQVIS